MASNLNANGFTAEQQAQLDGAARLPMGEQLSQKLAAKFREANTVHDNDKSTFQAQTDPAIAAAYAQAIQQGSAQSALAAGQQNAQIGQLQLQAQGLGPSVAQQQLQGATDQGSHYAAALAASQRGVNPALAARQAMMAQAQMQQQAAGQSAVLRAGEMQNAQGSLAQALAQKRSQDLGFFGTGMQTGTQNSLGIQGINANTADSNARNAVTTYGIATGAENAAAQREQDANNRSIQIAGGVVGGIAGGIAGPIGSAIGSKIGSGAAGAAASGGGGDNSGIQSPTMYAMGGPVPGRAAASGNSPRNDTVPAMLSPGEVVLPRSVTQSGDAPDKAAAFVAAIKAKKSGGGDEGYGAVLAKTKEIGERLKRIEAFCAGGMVK